MKNKNELDSYAYIRNGKTMIILITILFSISIFVAGILMSIFLKWWYFLIIYAIGIVAILSFYTVGLLFVSLCHNAWIIKTNLNNQELLEEAKLNGDKVVKATLKKIQKINSQVFDNDFDETNIADINECPNCFAKISLDDTECPNCGYKLK